MPISKKVQKNLNKAREHVQDAINNMRNIVDEKCDGYSNLTEIELNGMTYLFNNLSSFFIIMGEFELTD